MKLHLGDCLDVLRTMEADSIDAIVTDPPYGLGFMGKAWDDLPPGCEVFVECLRVLKPGGHLLAFGGTRTYHRLVVAIEDAGFEIRDMISWLYGSGFPKSHNGEWGGTALKPACEPICMARKPLAGTVAQNVQAHGTGALNIDGCRVPTDEALQGSTVRNDMRGGRFAAGHKPNPGDIAEYAPSPLGRWPANVIHDGSDEVVAGFPAEAGASGRAEGPALRGKSERGSMAGHFNGTDREAPFYADKGSAARFFYCAKASKADRDSGLDHLNETQFVQWQTGNGASGKPSSMSEGRDTRRRNIHPTVKPCDLMRYLCRLVTPPGGLILDPFMGSGSTGKAAILEGFRFVGIERQPEYMPLAEGRIRWALEKTGRLSELTIDTNPEEDIFG